MIKKYYDWFRRYLIPLLPLPALLIMYFVLRPKLDVDVSSFNNWYGVALQIIGGFQLVWSIDTNLRGFKGQTIVQTISRETIEMFKSFPLWSKARIVSMNTAGILVSAGALAKLKVSHTYTDLSQRVEFLERKLEHIEEALDNRIADLLTKLDEQRRDFQGKIAAVNTTSSELKTLITDVAVGGIRGQIIGLLIVVMGTVISAIQ